MNKHWSETARYVALVAVLAGLVRLRSAARALVAPLVIAVLLAYTHMPGMMFNEADSPVHRTLTKVPPNAHLGSTQSVLQSRRLQRPGFT